MYEKQRMVSIGESMVEMRQMGDGNYRLGFAGDTLNTAYYAKILLGQGADIGYFTCLGDDVYSVQMRQFIEENGISTEAVRIIKGKKPGLYLIHQEAGDRHFTYWRETSAARHLADDRVILEQALQDASIIYFSGITLGILSSQARKVFFDMLQNCADKLICFDPNIRPALWSDHQELKAAISHAARLCNIVLPTYSDEAELFGDATPQHMAARYLTSGAREVVVKNGGAAAFAQNKDEQEELAPPRVDKVIDATGAGDSFNAAYIAARIKGENMRDAMRSSHLVASQVIAHPGAIINRKQLDV